MLKVFRCRKNTFESESVLAVINLQLEGNDQPTDWYSTTTDHARSSTPVEGPCGIPRA